MPNTDPRAPQPAQTQQAALAIEGLAGLLLCVDPARFDSAARPSPAALAALVYCIGARLGPVLADAANLAA